MSFLADLKERKLVQWVLAYLAGAWLIWQVMDVMGDRWGLTPGVGRAIDLVLIVGLFVTLILAWYHGEQGRQRVSGPELLMIGGLFGLTAAVLTVFGGGQEGAANIVEDVPVRVPRVVLRARPAIAVLPFTNMSGDEENESFTRGIHDDILTQLSKIDALDVIARTSVMQYAETEKTIPDIGRELAVESVVEGGVQRAGNRVRINVQLIQAESNIHLWAETYDRELTAENIFAIQSEIARAIAGSLSATLTPAEGSRISQAPTGSFAAYDFYLRGREAYLRYTPEDNDEAIRLFREALAVDADYARAWAGLGNAFAQRPSRYGLPLSWADSAMVVSRRAVDIDPELADGHKALALALGVGGDSDSALVHYFRAVELDPSHFGAVANIGQIYFGRGQFADYHLWKMRAFRLSPNAPNSRTNVAWSYWNIEEYDLSERWAREAMAVEAEEEEARTILSAVASHRGEFELGMTIAYQILEDHPPSVGAYQTAAWSALFARDFERALPRAEEAMRLDPSGVQFHWHYTTTLLGFALLAAGERERGLSTLALAQERMEVRLEQTDSWNPVWDMAAIHAARGERDEAIRWAERAYESNGYRFPTFIGIDPMFDSVRDDPRFVALIRKMEVDVEETRRRIEREEVAAGVR